MLSIRASLAILLLTASLASQASAVSARPSSKSSHARKAHLSKSKKSKSHKLHGQQSIQPERVTEIQQALIREHYMTGEPNGQWNSTTQAAMQKFQGDQGWQTHLMPDSRALKKLGLGPDYSSAINARNANFSDPPPVSSIPAPQAAGFTAASKTAVTPSSDK